MSEIRKSKTLRAALKVAFETFKQEASGTGINELSMSPKGASKFINEIESRYGISSSKLAEKLGVSSSS